MWILGLKGLKLFLTNMAKLNGTFQALGPKQQEPGKELGCWRLRLTAKRCVGCQ